MAVDDDIPVSENESVFPGNNKLFGHWKELVAWNITEENRKVLCASYRKYADNLIKIINKEAKELRIDQLII